MRITARVITAVVATFYGLASICTAPILSTVHVLTHLIHITAI